VIWTHADFSRDEAWKAERRAERAAERSRRVDEIVLRFHAEKTARRRAVMPEEELQAELRWASLGVSPRY
jgi:hypothetical protein